MKASYAIFPLNFPTVLRPCARCGAPRPFSPTGQFRVNAQKKLLDVWLIHQCDTCGHTWNLEIFQRISPQKLDPARYKKLLANDEQLVRQYAFDAALHARMRAPLCLDALDYEIVGEPIELDVPCEIEFRCEVELGVRASRLIREALHLSHAQFESLLESGALKSEANLKKARMGRCLTVVYHPAIAT